MTNPATALHHYAGLNLIDIVAALSCVALMAMFVLVCWWYLKRVRDGRADPIVNPGDPTLMWPADRTLPLHHPGESQGRPGQAPLPPTGP